MGTTYWDYIRVDDLLGLQGGLRDDEDGLSDHEVVFITVHQVFELWFKLMLREIRSLRDLMARNVVPDQAMSQAARGLDRIDRILRVAAQHWQVVESLNTRDYLDFRDKLFPASGFQSAQMRQIEILLGLRDDERIEMGADGRYLAALRTEQGEASPALARVEATREDRPSLADAIEQWLERTPIRGSTPASPADEAVVDAFLEDYVEALRGFLFDGLEERLDGRSTDDEKAAVRARYEREFASARAWILPDDRRRRRLRAAVLFIESYRELPLLSWPREILDRLVEVEQGMLIFRQRHARMVERIIGRRVGTGGSSGVDYLDRTATSYRIFKDLWEVRTFLLPRDRLPAVPDAAYYDFARTS